MLQEMITLLVHSIDIKTIPTCYPKLLEVATSNVPSKLYGHMEL